MAQERSMLIAGAGTIQKFSNQERHGRGGS